MIELHGLSEGTDDGLSVVILQLNGYRILSGFLTFTDHSHPDAVSGSRYCRAQRRARYHDRALCIEHGRHTIASHIDREAYSIIGQLGFVPPGLVLDALEISPGMGLEEARARFTGIASFPLITSSDAHTLEGIGKSSTTFLMGAASVHEMKLALQGKEGRKVLWGEG